MFDKKQMDELMKKAGDIQQSLQTAQNELSNLEFKASDVTKSITIIMDGRYKLKKVSIMPNVTYDKDLFEALILEVVNKAIDAVENDLGNKIQSLYSDIPNNYTPI